MNGKDLLANVDGRSFSAGGTEAVSAGATDAGARGATRLVLETGDRQPEALGLYDSFGFVRIACFDEYASAPNSLCYEKWLSTPPVSR